ncbi:D-2-hydroxyacid dehydrogenase [Sutcliffiella horikoshii]|uniref:D-2-hydroxyacid dehydrogenase n=1 Tax=Sutcliffiella horikoshii TaxID=79883 RepID=A0AA94WRY7_9BACI|nr:D-2-hydroxyacid dehydrogenase [Sutcliffiella horikoshii]TYS59649.1 D-2-hydroxyacid dehydrogenase [Sutcliffiella horikoshii]
MKITNILFTGRLVDELEGLLNAEEMLNGKRVRFVPDGEVSSEDLDWADAFVAFHPVAHFQFANLKWVHSLGAGVDRYMALGDRWPEDVLLTRTITSFGQKIGEYTLSYMLKEVQHHNRFQEQQGRAAWKMVAPRALDEVKVVVFGTGEIGQELARILGLFGVQVEGVSRSGADKDHFFRVMSLGEIDDSSLAEADFIINTLPLTKETAGLFDERLFGCMNQAVIINVGRGGTVDHGALLNALDSGSLKAAVLDVFEEEPLPADSPLWSHPGVTVTPHISAITTPEEAVVCFLETLDAVESGGELRNRVDVGRGY